MDEWVSIIYYNDSPLSEINKKERKSLDKIFTCTDLSSREDTQCLGCIGCLTLISSHTS